MNKKDLPIVVSAGVALLGASAYFISPFSSAEDANLTANTQKVSMSTKVDESNDMSNMKTSSYAVDGMGEDGSDSGGKLIRKNKTETKTEIENKKQNEDIQSKDIADSDVDSNITRIVNRAEALKDSLIGEDKSYNQKDLKKTESSEIINPVEKELEENKPNSSEDFSSKELALESESELDTKTTKEKDTSKNINKDSLQSSEKNTTNSTEEEISLNEESTNESKESDSNNSSEQSSFSDKDIVKHIVVEGNVTLDEKDILSLITHTKEGSPYSKEQIKADLADISKSGAVQKVKARTLQSNGELYVIFDVTELSEVKSIALEGNTLIPTEELLPLLVTKEGEQFDKKNVEKDIDAIKDYYKEKGYIALISDVNNNDGNVTFHIAEAVVEDLVFNGNKKTKDWVMEKLIGNTVKKGDYLTPEALQKIYERLMDSGFFKDVKISADDGSIKGNVILKVDVLEAKTGEWSLGGGYSTTYKAEIVGGIRDRNLGGTGKSIGFNFGFGSGKHHFDLSYVDPYYKRSDTKVYFDLFKHNKDVESIYSKYTEDRIGASIGFVKPISKDKRTKFFGDFSFNKINIDNKEGAHLDNFKDTLLTIGVQHDTRMPDNPNGNGSVFEGYWTTSQKFLGSDYNFNKFHVGMKNYLRLSSKDQLASRLEMNYGTGDIPYAEQFSIGGADSLRALDEDSQKGNKSVLASLELRHDLSKVVQGVLFVDAGKAWSDTVNNKFKVGYGLGVRIKTAMGILRLDAAKTSGESIKYMFGIGQVF